MKKKSRFIKKSLSNLKQQYFKLKLGPQIYFILE